MRYRWKSKIDQLEAIFTLLIDHLKAKGIDSVDIDEDYYWNVPQASLYDPYHEPGQLEIGQLSDDWNELSKLLEGKKVPLAYHLVWFAAILRAIGGKVAG